jgi:hypothetical protein
LPRTPFTDSVEKANVSWAKAIRSLLTSRKWVSTLSRTSQAMW